MFTHTYGLTELQSQSSGLAIVDIYSDWIQQSSATSRNNDQEHYMIFVHLTYQPIHTHTQDSKSIDFSTLKQDYVQIQQTHQSTSTTNLKVAGQHAKQPTRQLSAIHQ